MQEVFRHQIQDAWAEDRHAGIAHVWLFVAKDVITTARPTYLKAAGIGLISLAASVMLFYIFSLDALPLYSPAGCSQSRAPRTHFAANILVHK